MERPAGKKLQSFIKATDGTWEQSPELKKVLSIMQDNTDKQINIEAAPSVMVMGGKPAWGSGHGEYDPKTGRAFVDPFAHPTVGAHEAAHQAFMTPLATDYSFNPEYQERMNNQLNNPANYSPEMVDKGATMRMQFETRDKPFMIEEANAQGVAQAAMDKAGIPVDTSGWPDMYAYPEAHRFGGQFSKSTRDYMYGANKPGLATLTPGEATELGAMGRSVGPAVRRQFGLGYQRIK